MNKDTVEGSAKQLTGKIRETWGKLTNDQAAMYKGKTEEFYGLLQKEYGLARDAAEKKMKELEKACGGASSDTKAA